MTPRPFTAEHPDCARLIERQRELLARMRRTKSHIYDLPAEVALERRRHTDVRGTFARAMGRAE